MHNNIYISSAV